MLVALTTSVLTLMLLAAVAVLPAQTPPPAPKSARLYVFDCGSIKGLSPAMFNFKDSEIKATEFVVPCYLVVHPKGTLMWDVGVIPDSVLKPDGSPVTQGTGVVMS